MDLDGIRPVRIGIITVSDRASEGKYEDISGPAIIETLNSEEPNTAVYQYHLGEALRGQGKVQEAEDAPGIEDLVGGNIPVPDALVRGPQGELQSVIRPVFHVEPLNPNPPDNSTPFAPDLPGRSSEGGRRY